MNGIPKNKLEKFGLSIRCNRRRNLSLTKAAKWTQSHFCEGICSQNSLINIEKGKIGRFIENYPKLAERLELQVVHSDEIDKRIVHFTKRFIVRSSIMSLIKCVSISINSMNYWIQ